MKIEQINSSLSNKTWAFSHSTSENLNSYSKATWSYKKSYVNDGEALGWLSFLSCDECFNRLIYQIQSVKLYNKITASFSGLHFKLIDSKINDNVLKSVYSNKSITVVVTSSSNEESATTIYEFYIYSNKDYMNIELANKISEMKQTLLPQDSFVSNDLYVTSLLVEYTSAPLRASPNVNADIIYQVPKSSTIHIKSRGDVYYQVEVDGYIGYLSQTFLIAK